MRDRSEWEFAHLQESAPLQEAQSLEARVEAVRQAIWARNDNLIDEDKRWFPIDVYEEFAIVRQGRRLLRVPYTFGEDGTPEFGEAEEVEVEFRPVRMQESVLAAARLVESEDASAEGLVWDIEIIHPGWALTGVYYPRQVLQEAAPLFEGAPVYYFDDEARGHKRNPLEKAPRFLAGWIDQVGPDPDGVLTGQLHFLQEGIAAPLRRQLVDAWRRGKTDLFGLSIDAHGLTRPGTADGRTGKLVESIQKVLSLDVVLQPAAGGRFTRLVASAAASDTPKEGSMKLKARLLRLLEARRPDAYAGIDPETVTIEEIENLLPEGALQEAFAGTTAGAGGAGGNGGRAAPQPTAPAAAGQLTPDLLQEARLIESRLMLREELSDCGLPDLTKKRIRERFEGQVATREQIQAAITAEREYLAELSPARIRGVGGPRGQGGVDVGPGKLDKLQAALDKTFGLEISDPALKGVKPIGLRQLYNEITLGHDPEVSGVLQESAVQDMLQEAFTNATLPRVVANTMHRRLLKDYRELDYGERRIISSIGSAADFKTQESIRVGYFSDLDDVDPETGDYPEIAPYGEEAATYSVGQKGNIVTVTRKHIINDDVGAFVRLSSRLGRAARRTFARFVWSFFKDNPVITLDGTAWFTAAHNNLLSVPLTPAALTSARNLLYNQTELSSGEKLGLNVFLLVVPIDLEETAIQINQSDKVPGSANNDANRWFRKFGANNENIVVNPFLDDPTDWGVFANPADVDIIEVKFLNGQEEPELWVADTPTVGQMFTADKLQMKIRHEYGGTVVDWRGAVKSVVADV